MNGNNLKFRRLYSMFNWYKCLHNLGVPKAVCMALVKQEMEQMGFQFKK